MSDLKEYALNGKKISPDEFVTTMKERESHFSDKFINPKEFGLDPNSNEKRVCLIHRPLFEKLWEQREKAIAEKKDASAIDPSKAHYPLNKWATHQLCQKLKIPMDFFLRCRGAKDSAGKRLDAHFDHWIGRCRKDWFVRFDNIADDNKIRAILSTRFNDISNREMAELLKDHLPNKYDYEFRFEWTDMALYGQIVTPKVSRKLMNGQEIKGGIRFKNSEVGFGRITLEMLVLSEATMSGPILPGYQGFSRTHIQKRDDLKQDFQDAVENLVGSMEDAVDLVKASEMIKLSDPQAFLETALLMHKLDKGQCESVREALQRFPLKTMYDAIQIFSVAATDPTLGIERREKLQRVSGELAKNTSRYGAWIAPSQPDKK
jgi:hypothetical protein